MTGAGVAVTGSASAEELAAVLAVLFGGAAPIPLDEPDAYTVWRRTRLAALRRRSSRR